MMRQLRVGKLDVGNGAVLVVAPEQGQAAAVLGAGVALEMGSHDKAEQLKRWINNAWSLCKKKNACGNWTENLMLAADHIRRDTRHADWTIAYSSLGDIQTRAVVETDDAEQEPRSLDRGGYTVYVKPKPKPKPVETSSGSTSSTGWAPPFVTPDPGSAQAIAYRMVTDRGWGDSEFSCLVALWNKESGWRVNAYNASSGAYGIP